MKVKSSKKQSSVLNNFKLSKRRTRSTSSKRSSASVGADLPPTPYAEDESLCAIAEDAGDPISVAVKEEGGADTAEGHLIDDNIDLQGKHGVSIFWLLLVS